LTEIDFAWLFFLPRVVVLGYTAYRLLQPALGAPLNVMVIRWIKRFARA